MKRPLATLLALVFTAASAAATPPPADAPLVVKATKNPSGTFGLAVLNVSADAALFQPGPLRVSLWNGAPQKGISSLSRGYDKLSETAPGEWLGTGVMRGNYFSNGKQPPHDAVSFAFTDRWTVAGNTLRLRREVRVRGDAPGGFNSVIAMRVGGAKPWPEMEWFVPGAIYGNSDHLRDNSFGAANYYKPGNYTVWIREDRLPAPLLAARLPNGASVAVLNHVPDGATNSADGLSFTLDPLASEDFRFGSIVAEEKSDTGTAIGYAFPGTEGTLTYGPKGDRFNLSAVQRSRYRCSPLKDGFVHRYEVTFRLSTARDTNDLVAQNWRWAWQTLKPQVNPQPVETLRGCMADVLLENVVEHDGVTGIRQVIASEANPKPASAVTKSVLGFTGYALGSAEMMLAEADRDPAAPRSQAMRRAAEKIVATFLRLSVNPPVAEGFVLGGENNGALAADQNPMARPLTEKTPIYLRSFCDDMKSLMRAFTREKKAGRDHPEWLAWTRKFGDWLLTQQQPAGGFPRSWHATTGELFDSSPSGTFNAVPFFAQLYKITRHQPYLDAALRAGEFAWNSGHARARFTGGTIDNPDVIDKEAATISLEGYLALHAVTRDSKWLERAQVAADIAETWMRIWNIPMPSDATQDQIHWSIGQSTVGMQLVATGHTGDDTYMAWDVESYARLSRETGNPHYMDVAKILLHNTKAMVGRPGDHRGTRGPGWQQEHCWLDLPRGKGRHRAWLPWLPVSHLRGINDLIDYDPALYKQLATATADETAAVAERIAAAARQPVRQPTVSPSTGDAASRRPGVSEWKYDRGPDPKTTGSLRVDGEKIILTGDFSKGGKRFVAASCPIALPGATLATFKVKTDQKRLYVRLVDATGQRHQQEHTISRGEVSEITVPFLASLGKASWGGANDDRLHLPLRAIEILVAAAVSGATGAAEISDVLFTGKNASAGTFTNPIAVGADPFITRHGGAYYWSQSENDLGVAICKSDSPASLGERRVVWRAPASGPHSRQIWAPELHFLDGRWYIYAAASDGDNASHRMIVLESATDDPLGDYTFKAELYTGDNVAEKTQNRWAIDGTVLTHRDRRYFIWSGWEAGSGNGGQWLYAAPMGNPWTVSGNRVRLCGNADHLWERVGETDDGLGLNEGPQILQHGGRTFLIYSASGSWQPSYKLGLLELVGDDPLNPGAWRKHPKPVFSPTDKTFGVGHGSFTTSPDGTQFWHVYHAKRERANGWARAIFAQPFTWTADGFPDFGAPVAPGRPVAMPSQNTAASAAAPLALVWDTANTEFFARGGYGRAKRLSNGEIALVWADGPVKDTAVYIRKKPSASATAWGPRIRVATPEKAAAPGENPDYRYVNSEMIELADGRLFYTWNARPVVRDGHLPYKIMGAFSSDGGATWSAGRDLYVAGDTWRTGCWEPCPFQLPSGELQVWFSNEAATPDGDQDITVLRSLDNGATFLPPVVACYRKGNRDGMPVPVLLRDGTLVFSIEDTGVVARDGDKHVYKPVIIRPCEDWSAVVDGGSTRRWEVFPPEKNPARPVSGAGAPYLIRLDTGETVLSCQYRRLNEKQLNLRVVVGDASARNFANPTTPFPDLPEGAQAAWNSLCQVDDDTLLAVSTITGLPKNNGVWIATAKIRRAKKQP
ncbi:family 43 glycosylhydrolase [Termitidicoccus mucosus]|uniref:Non-reducing end alpha-L-arabinofuranosidase n=1 Tax=Termitidicoccus mucosus TaxID=1184151 RepID=A0A178ID52_9BACT|nr:hypothetical protein AW736_21435 [Opitutaceae bacterium TSB47]